MTQLDLRLDFVLDKETKNTYRYKEEVNGQPPVVGHLYIQKWAITDSPPQTLSVTVTEGQ